MLDGWLERFEVFSTNVSELYWWTKGFAYAAYPIMPKLTTWLWQNLGHSGEPNGEDFLMITNFDSEFEDVPIGGTIQYQDVDACLPDSLKTS